MTLPIGSDRLCHREPFSRREARPPRQSFAAFTLVELTIVVFIMAVMMAVAVPYFAQYYNESKLGNAARMFATTCQLARLESVIKQRETLLQVDLDRQTYWLAQTGAADAGTVMVTEMFEVPQGIRLMSAQAGEDAARDAGQVTTRFYANGTCTEMTVVFRGRNKKLGTAVWVDPVTSRATPYAVKQ